MGGTEEERYALIQHIERMVSSSSLLQETDKPSSVVGSRGFHSEEVFRLGSEGRGGLAR